MILLLKRMVTVAALGMALANLAGCGGGETNSPSTQLTASTVTSTSVNDHSHSASIPFSDLAGTSNKSYRTSVINGHSHVIALAAGQLSDLQKGLNVRVTSSVSYPASDGHTHTFTIYGGNIVYESICYNCHSNDKRGKSQMNSTQPPLQSQKNALANPTAQAYSSVSPVIPDPNFGTTAQALAITTATTLPSGVVGTNYSTTLNATGGTFPYTWTETAGSIPYGMNFSTGGVIFGIPNTAGTINFTTQVADSANPNNTVTQSFSIVINDVAPVINGAALYGTYCAGCHGALANSTKRGASATTIQSAINGGMGNGTLSSLTTAQIQAIAVALQ